LKPAADVKHVFLSDAQVRAHADHPLESSGKALVLLPDGRIVTVYVFAIIGAALLLIAAKTQVVPRKFAFFTTVFTLN
jgi:hypothetical protein